jgi:hypothetical protein
MRLKLPEKLRIYGMFEILHDDFNPALAKSFDIHVFDPVLSRQIAICSQGFAYIDQTVAGIIA